MDPCSYSMKIFIFTGRNEVVAKVIFLHLFVILFRGGISQGTEADTPPQSRHPPGPGTPWTRHTPGPDIPPREDLPDQAHPQPGTPPPRPDTPPPWTRHPPDQTHHPCPGADNPPWTRHIPPEQTHPPGADTHTPQTMHPPPGTRLRHTVYEWPVLILLECILVLKHNF